MEEEKIQFQYQLNPLIPTIEKIIIPRTKISSLYKNTIVILFILQQNYCCL